MLLTWLMLLLEYLDPCVAIFPWSRQRNSLQLPPPSMESDYALSPRGSLNESRFPKGQEKCF